jgi:hypothetical protein
MFFLIWTGMDNLSSTSSADKLSNHLKNPIYFYFTIGTLMGSLMTMMVSVGRASQKFYREADMVEQLVKTANTKEELEHIWSNEFKTLANKSFHQQSGSRLLEIKTIIKTKYEMLCQIRRLNMQMQRNLAERSKQ